MNETNENKLLLSICIPTNGILKWVVPVLESIYSQNEDNEQFEVIVMDNGENAEFADKMEEFSKIYNNFRYLKTSATAFLCQVEAFKAARGIFVKFLNHRMILLPGTISYLLDFVKQNRNKKPIAYFSNGCITGKEELSFYNSFDSFVKGLSYWSSWSAGLAFWMEDFSELPVDLEYNELFPHITVLFSIRKDRQYCICDKKLVEELPVDNTAKGRYDLFRAFAIEYPSILLDLYRQGDIQCDTFLYLKKELLVFLTGLYLDFIILKKKCSYSLKNYKKSICVYFTMGQLRGNLGKCICIRLKNILINILKKIMKVKK